MRPAAWRTGCFSRSWAEAPPLPSSPTNCGPGAGFPDSDTACIPARTLARALFAALEDLPSAAPALAAARDVASTAARHTPLHGDVDLALAVFTASSGMDATAGETVFAVRTHRGMDPHTLEEYEERCLRMRPSGRYTGARPSQPLPE